MFPNQTYDMNIMINNYKQLIINVIDEIIEKNYQNIINMNLCSTNL